MSDMTSRETELWEAGYKAGFENGRNEGYEQGLADGSEEGYDAGYADGWDDGSEESGDVEVYAHGDDADPMYEEDEEDLDGY